MQRPEITSFDVLLAGIWFLLALFIVFSMARYRLGLIAVLALTLLTGCARVQPAQPAGGVPATFVDSTVVVRVNRPTTQFLALLQQRLQGHSKYPDHEIVLCLYGVDERPRYVEVTRLSATQIDSAGPLIVHFDDCPAAPDLIGLWHPHFPGDYRGRGVEPACWFSLRDTESFKADRLSILELVSCGHGQLIGRVKRKGA